MIFRRTVVFDFVKVKNTNTLLILLIISVSYLYYYHGVLQNEISYQNLKYNVSNNCRAIMLMKDIKKYK